MSNIIDIDIDEEYLKMKKKIEEEKRNKLLLMIGFHLLKKMDYSSKNEFIFYEFDQIMNPIFTKCWDNNISCLNIKDFIQSISFFKQSEIELIHMVVLLERFMFLNEKFKFTPSTWKNTILACLRLATKYQRDYVVGILDNNNFLNLRFKMKECNKLEIKLLEALNWNFDMSESDMEQIYFYLFNKREINKEDVFF